MYSADGQTLYSLGEDRLVKAWNAAQMVERRSTRTTEAILSFALRSDQSSCAGTLCGVIVLLDPATGKVLAEPLPIKPKPPQLLKMIRARASAGGRFASPSRANTLIKERGSFRARLM